MADMVLDLDGRFGSHLLCKIQCTLQMDFTIQIRQNNELSLAFFLYKNYFRIKTYSGLWWIFFLFHKSRHQIVLTYETAIQLVIKNLHKHSLQHLKFCKMKPKKARNIDYQPIYMKLCETKRCVTVADCRLFLQGWMPYSQ